MSKRHRITKLLNCEDCVKVAKSSTKNIKFAMTQEEFDDAMRKRGRTVPSQVDLIWECKYCGLKFPASYNNIKKGTGCPDCYGTIPINREDCVETAKNSNKDIEFVMTQDEFDKAMDNRGLLNPIRVKLYWKCKKCGLRFPACYNSIKSGGTGCPDCARWEKKDLGVFLINKRLVLSPYFTENLRILQKRIIRTSKRKGKFPSSIKAYELNHPNDYFRGSRFDKRTTRGTGILFFSLSQLCRYGFSAGKT